jgi:hypothetical protein
MTRLVPQPGQKTSSQGVPASSAARIVGLPGSAHRLVLQPYSIELPPHRNAMAGGVIKDQVEFRRQLNGSGHEQPNASRREVPYPACEEGVLLKRDHACLEAPVTRARSLFNASVHGNPAQGCPTKLPWRSGPRPLIGSAPVAKMIGTVEVTDFAASAAAGTPFAKIASTRRFTSSAASAGRRSIRVSAQR